VHATRFGEAAANHVTTALADLSKTRGLEPRSVDASQPSTMLPTRATPYILPESTKRVSRAELFSTGGSLENNGSDDVSDLLNVLNGMVRKSLHLGKDWQPAVHTQGDGDGHERRKKRRKLEKEVEVEPEPQDTPRMCCKIL
jgi:hypothetical protein